MPYSSQHMLLHWSGHFVDGSNRVLDDFAGSLRFVGPGVNEVNNQETAEDLWTTLKTCWQDQRSGIPALAMLDNLKWNLIGVDGKYVSRSRTTMVIPDVPQRGVLSARFPTQIACCTSWTTDLQRGRGSRGRTYWPTAHAVDSGSGVRLTAEQRSSMADWSLATIRALNSTASGGGPVVTLPTGQTTTGDPATVVAAIMSDLGGGTTGIIRGVRVGDRLDVQRRRGGRIEENYTARTFAQ